MKYIYQVEVLVEIPITLKVKAENEQEAFAKVNDSAWIYARPDYSKVKIKGVGDFIQGAEWPTKKGQ